MTTLAHTLSHHALEKICQRYALQEEGSPYLTLTSPAMPQPVGAARIWRGGPITKLVYIGLTVPFVKMDSHMFFAFTAPDSAVPHFTLDSVFAGEHFAFHCDLIPRVDLGAHLPYLDAAFHPLTPEFQAVQKIAGLSPAHLTPRQYAIMSPWMLAYRANEAAFAQIESSVNIYLNHWFSLLDQGVSAEATAAQLAERDTRNRAIIFNPAVDPVWAQVDRLLGAETSAALRELLKAK